MVLPSTFPCLLSLTLVSGNPLSDDRTTRRPRRREEEKERKVSTRNQDRQHRSVNSQDNQEGNPPGVNFSGMLNVTATGRTCQVWAASQPHEHDFTDVGEHNHCRNPDGDSEGVWCQTTDPDKEWEHCSVPLCLPTMWKVFDFSADNDQESDSNGEYTSATLDAGALPESFTICSAIMVEAWTTVFSSAHIFRLLDVDGDGWGYVELYAATSYTQYNVKLGPVNFVKQTEAVFFPLQWSRACLSLDSKASKVRLVVDGQQLGEEEYRR